MQISIALRARLLRHSPLLAIVVMGCWLILACFGRGHLAAPLMAALLAMASFVAHLAITPETDPRTGALPPLTLWHITVYSLACLQIMLQFYARLFEALSNPPWQIEHCLIVANPGSCAACNITLFICVVRGRVSAWFAYRCVFSWAGVVNLVSALGIWVAAGDRTQGYPPGQVSLSSSLTTSTVLMCCGMFVTPTVRQYVRSMWTVLPLTAASLQLYAKEQSAMCDAVSESSGATPHGLVRKLVPSEASQSQKSAYSSRASCRSFASSTASGAFPSDTLSDLTDGRSFVPHQRRRKYP